MKLVILSFIFQFIFSNQILIDLITTNDTHGVINQQKAYFMNPEYPPTIIGGAGFYKYVQELKEQNKNTNLLILDGGNFFQGSNFGMQDKGLSMIKWMNMIGYDAITFGQYDFVYGADNLNQILNQANFEVLASNINCNQESNCIDKLKPYYIKNIQGVNIGILGIVNSSIPELVPESKLDDISFSFEVDAIHKWVPIMKQDGADVIIVLTSSGVPWDREEVYTKFINSQSKSPSQSLNAIEMGYYLAGDVDLIVSGGISKGYRTAWYDPNSHVYTIQNYGGGTSFGHIQLKVDGKHKKFLGIEYVNNNEASHTLFLDDFEPDKNIEKWIHDNTIFTNNIVEFDMINNINSVDHQSDIWNVPSINTNDGIEIITWNCEFFPTANDSTINALSEIINDLDADIIAFQEIRKAGWFEKLMQKTPKYNYVISLQASFMDLAIIYKKDMFNFSSHKELFADNDYNFAGRPPLQLDLTHKQTNKTFSMINLHMKCCDSGLNRRKKASKMLYDYLELEFERGNKNFIVLGDWNDDLKDKPNEHCFDLFFNNKEFYFVNQPIINDLNQASYPKEPYFSFLDHILVTKSFINSNSISNVFTIPIDSYMNGYHIYESYISDHKPVLLSFNIN